MLSEEELRQKAKMRAYAKLGFYIHFSVYVVVNILLSLIWWFTKDTPIYFVNTKTYGTVSFPWFIFPLVGWGIGVLAHYLAVFARTGVTDRMVEKEYQKLKEKQQ